MSFSILQGRLKEPTATTVREMVSDILDGTINAGPVELRFPDSLTFEVDRFEDHIRIEWSPSLEVELPGPDPDLLRARLFEDHAKVDLHFSNIRINY